MAERRMLSNAIISSDAFKSMSLDAQALYFHMSMEADDDGFVNSAISIQRSIGASKNAISELVSNKFLIAFTSGIYLIKHWLINNSIRQDRYHATNYVKEKAMVEIESENRSYRLVEGLQPVDNQVTTTCQPTANQMEPEVSIGKVSIDTYSELLSDKSSNNSSYVCPEPSEKGLQADNDPVFLTILTNTKKEFPIHESDVKRWADTFPAVDVRAELKKMKTWSEDNPPLRKTERGMKRFVGNWLSKEQDRAGRPGYRNQEQIKGTNINMPVTADGSDREKYKEDPNEILRKYGLLPGGGN